MENSFDNSISKQNWNKSKNENLIKSNKKNKIKKIIKKKNR